MPTLIRLLVALLFLGGLGYAGLFALTVMVDPGEKDFTIRIPARELVAQPPERITINTSGNPTGAIPSPAANPADAGADQPE